MAEDAVSQKDSYKMRRGVYAGSFDPVTNGHLWMIERGVELFDEMIIAIGENPEKLHL